MAWGIWRGLHGGCIAALLLVASASPTLAANAAEPANPAHATTAAKPAKPAVSAAKPAKPAAIKTAAKKPAPVPPAKQVAAAKPTPPGKKLAAAPKKPEAAKKIATAAKKPKAPAKIAAAAPPPAPPSYTVTTRRGDVTYTTTRIVPLPSSPAAATPVVKAASTAPAAPTKAPALPVNLTQQAAGPAPQPQKPAPAVTQKPAPAATPVAATQPPDAKAAAPFVSSFLKEAFRLTKQNGMTSLQRRAELADLFASKMDMKRIAGYTTADELAALSPELQQRFRTILVSYLVETYYPQLELAADPSIKVETAAARPLPDGTAVVWTTFTKDGWGSQSVQWHLAAEDGGFKIIDIFSAGASLVQMERDTFQSVMRDGGLSQLMAKLDARTKELASAATE